MAAANHGQYRGTPSDVGKRAEQGVARAEHGTRAHDRRARERPPDREFPPAACADVGQGRVGVGADAGDKHVARDAGGRRGPRDRFGASLVNRREGDACLLDVGRDRVDDGVRPGDGGDDGRRIAHVSPDDRDSLGIGNMEGTRRPLGLAHRDTHRHAVGGEALHKPSAEEAGAAEYADRGHPVCECVTSVARLLQASRRFRFDPPISSSANAATKKMRAFH